jgi:hypothetical protein
MDRLLHLTHSWININSPRGLDWYLFLLLFIVNPIGFIGALQADRWSPAE